MIVHFVQRTEWYPYGDLDADPFFLDAFISAFLAVQNGYSMQYDLIYCSALLGTCVVCSQQYFQHLCVREHKWQLAAFSINTRTAVPQGGFTTNGECKAFTQCKPPCGNAGCIQKCDTGYGRPVVETGYQ